MTGLGSPGYSSPLNFDSDSMNRNEWVVPHWQTSIDQVTGRWFEDFDNGNDADNGYLDGNYDYSSSQLVADQSNTGRVNLVVPSHRWVDAMDYWYSLTFTGNWTIATAANSALSFFNANTVTFQFNGSNYNVRLFDGTFTTIGTYTSGATATFEWRWQWNFDGVTNAHDGNWKLFYNGSQVYSKTNTFLDSDLTTWKPDVLQFAFLAPFFLSGADVMRIDSLDYQITSGVLP